MWKKDEEIGKRMGRDRREVGEGKGRAGEEWRGKGRKRLMEGGYLSPYAIYLPNLPVHSPPGQVHQHLPGYTRKQIQTRWKYVNPERIFGHFSEEEEVAFVKVRAGVVVVVRKLSSSSEGCCSGW